jgi:hypothetical protein
MITNNSYKGIEKVFDNQFLDYLELERVFAND